MRKMLSEKLPSEKLGQIKDTFSTSYRLLKLIWSVDRWLFIGTFTSAIIPAIIPFINIYIYKLVIDLVVLAVSTDTAFDPSKLY